MRKTWDGRTAVAAVFCTVLTVFTANVAGASSTTYSVIDLGVSGGLLTGINDYGQVIGWTSGTNGIRPFVWTPANRNGTTGSLSSPAGLFDGAATDAWGISASGQLAGRSNQRAVIWDPVAPNSGTYGSPIELTQAQGPQLIQATGINATGQVIGRTQQPQGFLFTAAAPNGSSGSVIQLGTLPPAQVSFATGINNYGQVTGTSFGAFVWTPDTPNGTTGRLTGLGPNSGQTDNLVINASGSIAGSYVPSTGSTKRSFLWTPATPNSSTGSYIDLGTLPGATRIAASGLNDRNQIVGSDGPHGFMWTAGAGLQDLNGLLNNASAATWDVQTASAINNLGQIGAYALLNEGGQQTGHFVLLNPDIVFLIGDINLDGHVGFDDLLTLAQHYGQPGGPAEGDLNQDGTVGFEDLLLLAQHYGQTATALASPDATQLPEPVLALILAPAVTICGRLRKPRR